MYCRHGLHPAPEALCSAPVESGIGGLMLWVGLILLAVAAVLFFLSRRSENKVHYVKATETSKIGAIDKLVAEVAADMPDGVATGFKDYVEVKGRIASDEPIRGEISDQVGAIVETQVVRVAERREETRDAQGHIRTEWRKHEETDSSNRRESPFWVDDGSGRLRVKAPGGRGGELVKVMERFEAPSANESGFGGQITLSMGRFQMSLGSGRWDPTTSRTLGYRFIERVLPIGKPVYALGEVAMTEDEGLVLRPPTDEDKKKPFMVSPKTEEDIVKSAEKSARIMRVIAIVLGVAGIGLAVWGAIRR